MAYGQTLRESRMEFYAGVGRSKEREALDDYRQARIDELCDELATHLGRRFTGAMVRQAVGKLAAELKGRERA